MAQATFLAVDSGTSRMKAALFDDMGSLLAQEACDLPVLHPFDGASEADMAHTWQALCGLTRALAAGHPAEWAALQALCVAGQGDGCWPVDDAGQPVRHALLWNDTRTRQLELHNTAELEQFCTDHSQTQLFPGAGPMLLLWMKHFEPQAFQRVRWVLHCKDWLNLRLTGEVLTDGSDASTALLNVRTTRYEYGLLDLLGLSGSAACFPPVGQAGSRVGSVTAEAARQTGLPQGLAVILGGIDVAVMAAGAGVTIPGQALTIIGTTLCNEVVMNAAQIDHRDTRGSILQHVVPGAFLRLMATSSGTSSIDWARQALAPGMSFAGLEAAIDALPVGSEGVMFQPYLYGERAPFRDAAACAGFYGLSARHTPMHMLRAVYEGLALSFAECYQALPPVSSVALTGGGANSDALCQMMADSLGKPVRRTGIPELGITGAFAVLRRGLGLAQSAEPAAPGAAREFLPDAKRQRRYAELLQLFVDLRRSLQAYWSSRQGIFRSEF